MINWKVRIKNKTFWLVLVPALAVLIEKVAALFGFSLDLSDLSQKIIGIVEAVFIVLGILGIVVDPTTAGIGDSARAMSYEEPWKDPDEVQPPDEGNG